MKTISLALITGLLLAACAQTGNSGNTQAYGEIKAGVETSHTSH